MDDIRTLSSEFLPDDFAPLPKGALDQDEIVRKPTTYVKDVWRAFRKNKVALVSFIILLILVFFVLFGPMMNSYDYVSNDYCHQICLQNEQAEIHMTFSSKPDPDNPKSSSITAWSVLALLKQLASPIRFF